MVKQAKVRVRGSPPANKSDSKYRNQVVMIIRVSLFPCLGLVLDFYSLAVSKIAPIPSNRALFE